MRSKCDETRRSILLMSCLGITILVIALMYLHWPGHDRSRQQVRAQEMLPNRAEDRVDLLSKPEIHKQEQSLRDVWPGEENNLIPDDKPSVFDGILKENLVAEPNWSR